MIPAKKFYYFLIIVLSLTYCQNSGNTRTSSIEPGDGTNNQVSEQHLPLSEYHIYRGNSHSHTIFTWSHGPQRESFEGPFNPDWKVPAGTDLDDHTTLSLNPDDYTDRQGLPANHFILAKEHGYDFYFITDHSQEVTLQPAIPENRAWQATLDAAAEYDNDPDFVAVAGFEFSRNTSENGGAGHINAVNTAEYVNADHREGRPPWPQANWNIPKFFDWLKTVELAGEEAYKVASFNHPGVNQYNDWDNLDDEIVELITLFELHTNYGDIRWEAWLRALNKGWKLAPIGVHDNHSYDAIVKDDLPPPTFVLAPELTKKAITQAMRKRRTFVSWNKGVELRYSVNDFVMGSILDDPEVLEFQIDVSTRSDHPEEQIRRIEILRNHSGGEDDVDLVTYKDFPEGREKVRWNPVIEDDSAMYFLVRVYHANDVKDDGNFKEHASTYSTPVWTGR